MKPLLKQEVHRRICRQVAAKFNMSINDVDYIYHQYWATLRDQISKIAIKDFKDPSEIENYFKSYSIMHLGKFYTTRLIIYKAKQSWEKLKKQDQ